MKRRSLKKFINFQKKNKMRYFPSDFLKIDPPRAMLNAKSVLAYTEVFNSPNSIPQSKLSNFRQQNVSNGIKKSRQNG